MCPKYTVDTFGPSARPKSNQLLKVVSEEKRREALAWPTVLECMSYSCMAYSAGMHVLLLHGLQLYSAGMHVSPAFFGKILPKKFYRRNLGKILPKKFYRRNFRSGAHAERAITSMPSERYI